MGLLKDNQSYFIFTIIVALYSILKGVGLISVPWWKEFVGDEAASLALDGNSMIFPTIISILLILLYIYIIYKLLTFLKWYWVAIIDFVLMMVGLLMIQRIFIVYFYYHINT